MLPAHGVLQNPGYRKTTRLAAVPVCAIALIIVLFAFVPAFTETSFENSGLLFLLNAVFLSAVSCLVAGLALVGHLRSGRVEPLLVGCGVLFSGLGALIAGLIAGGERSPNDFLTVHNLGVFLAAAMHLAAAFSTARHTPAAAPASHRVAVGAYGATVGFMLLLVAAERADILPAFYTPGIGSTRIRQLILTGAISLMSIAAGILGVEARRLHGVSLSYYNLGLMLTAFGLAGAFLSFPGSVLSWAGRVAQYTGNLYLLAAVLVFIRLARRQQVEVRLAVAEFFSESTDHYRALVENMKGAVVSIDPAGRVFLWNPAAEQMFGYSADEAMGRQLSDLVAAEEDRDKLRAALVSVGQTSAEMTLRREDGSTVVAEMSTVSAGRAGNSVIIQDITDRRNAEDALRRAYEQRRLTLEAAEMGAWDYRFETGEVYWDQRCRQMWGMADCDQIAYDTALDRIHPEDRPVVDAAVKRAIDGVGDGAYRQEFRVVWPDGTIRWVASHGRVFFRSENGQRIAVRFIGANRDITQRKLAEAATGRNLRRLGFLARTAADLLYASDPRAIVASLGGRVMGHLGCDMFFNYLVDGQTDRLRLNCCGGVAGIETALESLDFGSAVCACARTGKRFAPDRSEALVDPCIRVVSALGVKAFVCHPLLGPGGTAIGTLAFGASSREAFTEEDLLLMQAVSDQIATAMVRIREERALRESERELQQLNESLERRVAERTGMLERTVGVLNREVEERLKTERELSLANQQLEARAGQLRALAGELTMAEFRERHRTGKILHDHLQQLLSSTKMQVSCLRREREVPIESIGRIEDLMAEALQVTRSLTGELSPPILQVAGLKAGLEWLARRMAERLDLEVAVTAECDPLLPEQIKILVFEAVRELLFNCVKHSGVQRADVSISRDDTTLCVTVSDEGCGFDATRLDTPGEMGAGFGLFSLRERLQLVGGVLEIESALNAGSRFRLRLPLAGAGSNAGPPLPSDPSTHRIRVLLVDDHAIMREGLGVMLSKESDIEVVGEAQDGWQALGLARRLKPDVVLMDIGLPGLNGIEATRILSAELPGVRILGLSMLYEEGEGAEAIREAGAVGYVAKSAPSREVLAALRGCMSVGGQEIVQRNDPYV